MIKQARHVIFAHSSLPICVLGDSEAFTSFLLYSILIGLSAKESDQISYPACLYYLNVGGLDDEER
jgi:hypothetical protein